MDTEKDRVRDGFLRRPLGRHRFKLTQQTTTVGDTNTVLATPSLLLGSSQPRLTETLILLAFNGFSASVRP